MVDCKGPKLLNAALPSLDITLLDENVPFEDLAVTSSSEVIAIFLHFLKNS